MKQNIFMAALLAAMLAIAGCGGGSSSTGTGGGNDTGGEGGSQKSQAAQTISTAIAACADAACVDDEIAKAEADGSGVSAEELATLQTEAETRKMAIANADPSLSESELAAAFQLLDALADSEALELTNDQIRTNNAELTDASLFTEDHMKTFVKISGWEGKSYEIRNPENVFTEEHDLRIWTKNNPYRSQKYVEFFVDGNPEALGVTRNASFNLATNGGQVNIPDGTGPNSALAAALPGNFFTEKFTRVLNSAGDAIVSWELTGTFFEVPGKFVCLAAAACSRTAGNGDSGDLTVAETPIGIGLTANANGITFIPSRFGDEGKDATDVPAKWAKDPDPKFMSFGSYWNTDYNDKGVVTSVRVDPFAGGAEPYMDTASIVTASEGSLIAKYEGGAAGVFVTTRKDANNDVVATGWGEFQARANLEANFGNAKDTLSATFDNFQRIGTTGKGAPGDDWMVKLSGDIKTGKVDVNDSFHASFQGEPRLDKDGNIATIGTTGFRYAPYGVVGTFQSGAQIPNAQVTGAFGAECRGTNCSAND